MICTLTASEDLDSKLGQKKEACEKERKQPSELTKITNVIFIWTEKQSLLSSKTRVAACKEASGT